MDDKLYSVFYSVLTGLSKNPTASWLWLEVQESDPFVGFDLVITHCTDSKLYFSNTSLKIQFKFIGDDGGGQLKQIIAKFCICGLW